MYRYRFGTAEFDEARSELRVAGLAVELQPRPVALLALLLQRADQLVTKEELLERVWVGRLTVENVLPNAMAKLRAALGDENADRIFTVPRKGYRLTGPIERIAVGTLPPRQLNLKSGARVPGRTNFVLDTCLQSTFRGEVWRAHHAQTHERRIYKFAATAEQLTVLKREATLLRVLAEALGERPDIVRLIDWNFEDTPYFVECEYGGRSLTEWARDPATLAALDRHGRLALFLQLTDVLAAAHGIGVLHKDIKPANILLTERADGSWQIQLADFGNGQLLDAARLERIGITRMGVAHVGSLDTDTAGTALYLAPELLTHQPPTMRSDLYALGVVLYQLLVGDLQRPLATGWQRDIDDPLLCEDIGAATEGNPAHRLASVADLAQRLRALSERREARAALEAAERTSQANADAVRKARARRPWLVGIVAALAAGLTVSVWLYRDAAAARDRLANVNRFLNWDVLANTGALKTDTSTDPTMRRVLNSAASIASKRFPNDPGSEGWIRYGIGEGLLGLGDYQGAIEQEQQAVALTTRAYGPDDDRTLDAVYGLASTLVGATQLQQAEALLRSADTKLITGQHTALLHASSQLNWAELHLARLDCVALERVARNGEKLYPQQAGNSDYVAYDLFNLRRMTADALTCQGRFAAAETAYRSLLGSHFETDDIGPALLGETHLGLARALSGGLRASEAATEAATGIDQIVGGVGDLDSLTTGSAYVMAGRLSLDLGHLELARTQLRHGQELLTTISPNHAGALRARRALAVLSLIEGRSSEALHEFEALEPLLARSFGDAGPDAQLNHFWLTLARVRMPEADPQSLRMKPLQPQTLMAALPAENWPQRLDALASRVRLARQNGPDERAALAASLVPLRAASTPDWLLTLLAN